jgi:ribosomal protein L12E/L44/L45/RPP1/RPP2
MRISRQELERLIKEELQEALEQYPADAMAEITATIFSLADQAGVETTGDQRENIVREIEELLRGKGFELREQELVFAEPLNLDLGGTQLGVLMLAIRNALPGSWNQMIKAFERGGINTGLALEPEDDEDHAPTVTVPPVSPPEEEEEEDLPSILTVADPEEEGEEDIPSILTVADPESVDASEFNKFFLTLDDQSMKALIKEVPRMPFTGALAGADDATKARFYEFISPRAQEYLEDDQEVMVGHGGGPLEPEDIHRYQQEVLEFARDMGLGKEESFENPWAFKWFWEDDAMADLDDDREDSEIVRNLKSIPTGKEITIGVIAGLAGTAGLYALWKYLFGAEDDEQLPPGLAQSVADQAEELEALSGIDIQDPEFMVSVIKWVLSLTLDEGQMEWVNRIEPIIRTLSQQEWTGADRAQMGKTLSALLDDVPGIELIDKLPGGREKVVEVMMGKWDGMSDKERIDTLLMLAPEEYLEMLDQAIYASPRMSEIPGMDFPGVRAGLRDWLDEVAGEDFPDGADFDPPLWVFMLLAGARLGLLPVETAQRTAGIIYDIEESVEESKEDGKVKRGLKLMKMLLQEQQLNRMKVLAGVR